jgi:hypothetical protein
MGWGTLGLGRSAAGTTPEPPLARARREPGVILGSSANVAFSRASLCASASMAALTSLLCLLL